jgi:hypothetical protein
LGKLNFRQHWLQREVSESLTVTVLFGVTGLGIFFGFVGGWLAAMSTKGSCYYMPVMIPADL